MGKSKPRKARSVPIADQLRKRIKNSGLSIYALAKETGIAQPVLHRFFTGERDLTLTTADKLVEFFELDLKPKKSRSRR